MNFISNGKFIRLYTSAKKWAACTPKDCKNIEFVLNNNKTKELIKNEYINLDDLSMLFAYPKPLEFIVENNPEILEYKAAYTNPESFLETNIEDGDLKKRVYKLAKKNIYYLRNINEIQNKVTDNKKILTTYMINVRLDYLQT